LSDKPRDNTSAGGDHPETYSLPEAIDALNAGELVVYPTETFYAIGADPFSPAALRRLFALKGREATRLVALIAGDRDSALSLAREVPPAARRLAEMFWPGALTLILPARDGLPPEIAGADHRVGVRVSPHPIARALTRALGRPITATSANRTGEPPARTLGEARAALGDKVKVYLEGGTLTAAAPSTIVMVTREEWSMVREGAILERELAAALAEEVLE
jgi:L-threonylcarbamoyladenylate synthase